MSDELSSRDRLQQKIEELQTRQSENKYDLLKEIHRVKDNSLKNVAAIVTVVVAITGYLGWEYLLPEAVNRQIQELTTEAVTELGETITTALEIRESLESPLIVFVSDHGDSDPLIGTLYKSSPRARIHVTPKPNAFNRFSALHASWSLLKLSGRFPDQTIFVSPSNPGDPITDLIFLQVLDKRAQDALPLEKKENMKNPQGRTLYFVGYDSGSMDLIHNQADFEIQEYRRIITPKGISRTEFDQYRRRKLAEIIMGVSSNDPPKILGPSEKVLPGALVFGRYSNQLEGRKSFWYEPEFDGERYTGVVLEVDDYGNITTNLKVTDMKRLWNLEYGNRLEVIDAQGNRRDFTFAESYGGVEAAEEVCIELDGHLQLAISFGNLEDELRWKPGYTVSVRKSAE